MSGTELQVGGEPPGGTANLPDAKATLLTSNQLAGEQSPVKALLMEGSSSSSLKRLVELGQQKEVPYGDGFQALLLQAGTRCVQAAAGRRRAASAHVALGWMLRLSCLHPQQHSNAALSACASGRQGTTEPPRPTPSHPI